MAVKVSKNMEFDIKTAIQSASYCSFCIQKTSVWKSSKKLYISI